MSAAAVAEEVELEVGDALADLTMFYTLVVQSPIWTQPFEPEALHGKLRVAMADRWLGGWTREQWRERFDGFSGSAFVNLTQQWIVATYARWEVLHRPRLVASGHDGSVDLFGDVRHLRHDIVHHAGVATRDHAERCRVLSPWAQGDVIALGADHFTVVMDYLATWVVTLGGKSNGRIHRDSKSGRSTESP